MFYLNKVGLMRVDCLVCIYLRFFLFFYYVDSKVAGPIKNVVILVLLMSIDSINCTEDQCHIIWIYIKKIFKQLNVLNFSPSLEVYGSMSIDDYIDTTMKCLLLCFHTCLIC